MKLENKFISAVVENGVITQLICKADETKTNLIRPNGRMGSVGYTTVDDDITKMKDDTLDSPYACRINSYSGTKRVNGRIVCTDEENGIETSYWLENELIIESHSFNNNISMFAINLDFNFMGFKGTRYTRQLLPTSPYTSDDGRFTYCIMTRPCGGFAVAVSEAHCEGWKIDYNYQHYIEGFQIISDFDKVYKKTANKYIKVRIFFCQSIGEAYERIGKIFDAPYAVNILSGGFGEAVIKLSGGSDSVRIISPSGKQKILALSDGVHKINLNEYGLHTVYAYRGKTQGLNTTVWYGGGDDILFKKSMDSIRRPYHSDYNLCEGGMFLWAMLVYMRRYSNRDYETITRHELDIIMGENGNNVPRRTILAYKTEYPAYHISGSDRIQEQFTGISILLEAYKVFGEEKYLEHAVLSLEELAYNRIDKCGRIWCTCGGECTDYTTVCAPVITIADMTLFLEKRGDKRSQIFRKICVKIADYLVQRGFDFPTEGAVRQDKDREYEDGSISCTALSVLYVCQKIEYKQMYVDFAKEILELHNAWTIYTPDARMYQSTFRWWETIWEGDGEGPAICAGHAWTIWRAEALYFYGLITSDDKALLDSWNGFVTNFAKITPEGVSYSCYEADFIRGGGMDWAKSDLLQLKGEDLSTKYVLAHGYPEHCDNSLSRYVWARYDATWQDTAAIVYHGGIVIGINACNNNGIWNFKKTIKSLIIGSLPKNFVVKTDSKGIENIYSKKIFSKISDNDITIFKIN